MTCLGSPDQVWNSAGLSCHAMQPPGHPAWWSQRGDGTGLLNPVLIPDYLCADMASLAEALLAWTPTPWDPAPVLLGFQIVQWFCSRGPVLANLSLPLANLSHLCICVQNKPGQASWDRQGLEGGLSGTGSRKGP